MAVLRPLKVILSNLKPTCLDVPHYPFDPSRGSHKIHMSDIVYIDHSDFRLEDDEDFFGLAPGKMVALRYAMRIVCESHEMGEDGQVALLRCRCLTDDERPDEKPKGMIQFVPESAAEPVEVRVYNPLFTVEEPSDEDWEKQLNPESEIVYGGAMVDRSVFLWKPLPETMFQFERIGFFTVDKDSLIHSSAHTSGQTLPSGANADDTTMNAAASSWAGAKMVFNLTVNLKDSKPKVAGGGGATRSRKDEQAKQLADKLVSRALFFVPIYVPADWRQILHHSLLTKTYVSIYHRLACQCHQNRCFGANQSYTRHLMPRGSLRWMSRGRRSLRVCRRS